MSYSQDLKEKVLSFIRSGGKKIDASRLFGISRNTIWLWLNQPEGYQSKKPGVKDSRKFKRADLALEVEANADRTLREYGKIFGVSDSTICHAFKMMGITRKKNGYGMKKVLNKKTSDDAI